MASDPLVRAYAEALFHVARAEERLDRVEEELTQLRNLIESNPELREFLSDPKIASPGKKNAFSEMLGKAFSPAILHWINMVVDQGRQRRLSAMIETFFTLAQESREKVTAEVITSTPLPQDLMDRLEKELSKVTRKRVFLKPLLDETVLGGAIVRFENRVIDGSVRHRLEEIKKEMVKTP